MCSRWVDDQFFDAQRTHMLCCDPRPLGRSLICRGVLFFARGWRGAVWGGFQPVADITTGITERALLDLDQSEDDRAAPGIVHNVSRELRDGCCDDSQVGRGKAALCRQLASLLAGNDDVGVRTYRHSPFISDACEPQWLGPCRSR